MDIDRQQTCKRQKQIEEASANGSSSGGTGPRVDQINWAKTDGSLHKFNPDFKTEEEKNAQATQLATAARSIQALEDQINLLKRDLGKACSGTTTPLTR